MDKTDRLRDYGLAFLLYEQGLGVCGYELIRELFIFVKLILNSYLEIPTTIHSLLLLPMRNTLKTISRKCVMHKKMEMYSNNIVLKH